MALQIIKNFPHAQPSPRLGFGQLLPPTSLALDALSLPHLCPSYILFTTDQITITDGHNHVYTHMHISPPHHKPCTPQYLNPFSQEMCVKAQVWPKLRKKRSLSISKATQRGFLVPFLRCDSDKGLASPETLAWLPSPLLQPRGEVHPQACCHHISDS